LRAGLDCRAAKRRLAMTNFFGGSRILSEHDSADPIDLGPLTGHLGYLLRRAQLAVFQAFHARFAELDIRPAQYSVLTVLQHNPGLRQSTVAEALGIKSANFVVVIEALLKRGLIRRERMAGDRRAFALHLTEEGACLVQRLDSMVAAHNAEFIARIGKPNLPGLLDMLRLLAGD
jgi:DNA-binding MarR family transcriptional regulator